MGRNTKIGVRWRRSRRSRRKHFIQGAHTGHISKCLSVRWWRRKFDIKREYADLYCNTVFFFGVYLME